MRIRLTEKGVSLVILIVIITVIGALGAGIVSFMGAKQRSYLLQAQAYQALNLANAGVEFAIRYAKDRFDVGESVKDCLGTAKTINFGNGSFEITYIGEANYTLKSIGRCGSATREVRLNRFPGYIMGQGFVLTKTIDSQYSPYDHSSNVNVPLTNLYDQTIYIKQIKINMNPDQGSSNRIKTISVGGNVVYDYNSDPKNPNIDGHGANKGICIPTSGGGCPSGSITPARIPYGFNLNQAIPPGSITEILDFSSASVRGNYIMTFTYDFNTDYKNPKTATMTFTIQ
ncbi:MAG TPA: hypothetical protein PKW07_01915 [Syntrophorhabdaceae bacterium]|nr:hypothetical protein [Syntrophorhabdaceae bacterium]